MKIFDKYVIYRYVISREMQLVSRVRKNKAFKQIAIILYKIALCTKK